MSKNQVAERVAKWRKNNPEKAMLNRDKEAARHLWRRYGKGVYEFMEKVKNGKP